jgi:hypothetical protein
MARGDGPSLGGHRSDQLPMGCCSGVHPGGRPCRAAPTNARAIVAPGPYDQACRVVCRRLPGDGSFPSGERANQSCGGVQEEVGVVGSDRDGDWPADLGRPGPGDGPQGDALAMGDGTTRLAVAAGWDEPITGWVHASCEPTPLSQALPTGEASHPSGPTSTCPADNATDAVRSRPPASPHSH